MASGVDVLTQPFVVDTQAPTTLAIGPSAGSTTVRATLLCASTVGLPWSITEPTEREGLPSIG
jgi:hypothetical protein